MESSQPKEPMAERDLAVAVRGALACAMTASEVAAAVGCDTNAAHAALVALLRDGLISCRKGRPNIWSPAPVVHEKADAPTVVHDAPNWARPHLETAVLSALSATPITALALAKRLSKDKVDHRAKRVNPILYALKARGEVAQGATKPPTWSTPLLTGRGTREKKKSFNE